MSQDHECPSCDYTTDSARGVAIHHFHAHGESIAKSTYECDICGESFERYDCNMKGENTFCSRGCHDEHFRQLDREERPNYQGGLETVACATCGTEQEVRPHRLERSERFFCGGECYGEWLSENWVGPDSPSYKSIEVECEWCGDTTTKNPAKLERDEHNFCSHDCHNNWMSENLIGPASHKWTGGRRDYGNGWNDDKKEAVRERDGHECYECGMTQAESIAEYGRRLDVHHLVVPDSDTNPAVHNAKRNLVTLCIPCHRERERNSTPADAVTTAMEVCES